MRLLVFNNIFGIVTMLATVISDSNSTMRNTGQTCFGHKTTTNCVRRAVTVRSFVIMPSLTHVLLRGHTLILQPSSKVRVLPRTYVCMHYTTTALSNWNNRLATALSTKNNSYATASSNRFN